MADDIVYVAGEALAANERGANTSGALVAAGYGRYYEGGMLTTLTVAGFAIGLIGTIATVWALIVGLRSRNRKRLAWEARTSPMLSSDARLRGELDIRFHGEPVTNPHAVVIEVRNTGDAPLRADDFTDPLAVRFEPGAYWMLAVVVADPDDRSVPFEKEGGVVSFRPDLLQPGESVYVHGLFDGDPGDAVPSARVAGVKEVEPLRRERTAAELMGQGVLEALRVITSVFVGGVAVDLPRRDK